MWLSRFVPGTAPDGSPILSVLGKRTYTIAPGVAAEVDYQNPIDFFEADEFIGSNNPATDPVRHESDLCAYKTATDLIIHGKAHAPRGKRARFFDLTVGVNEAIRQVRVIGNRKVVVMGTGISFTEPELFEEMPLHFGLAYGGADTHSVPDTRLFYQRNPVGKGFVVDPPIEKLHGLELPNLENPAHLLTPANLLVRKYDRWRDQPTPRAFGYTCRHSYPRILLAGLPVDQATEAEADRQAAVQKAPEVGTSGTPDQTSPVSIINHQYYCGAPELMQFPFLKGAETITLMYMDPDLPRFEFQLPGDRPVAFMDVGEGAEEMPMFLHTVEVFKPTNQITLVWRGCCRYGGLQELANFEKLDFWVESVTAEAEAQ